MPTVSRSIKQVKSTKRRQNSWRAVSKKRTLSHRLKLVAVSFFGVLVAAVFFGGFSFLQFLKSPLTLASGVFPEGRVWDKTSPLNLVLLVTDDSEQEINYLLLLTADKYQNSVSVVNLPANLNVDYPLGLGQNPLSAAIVLGNSLEPRIGVGLIEKVLKKNMAVPVDKYCLIKASALATWGQNPADFKELLRIKNLPKLSANVAFVKDNVSTNLSLGEMGELLWFLRGVLPTQIFIKDYTWVSSLSEVDSWWTDFYARGAFKQNRQPVLVLNGTSREGLGGWGGRLVANLGGDTLATTNSYGTYIKTFIIADDANAPIVRELGRFFSVATVSKPSDGAGKQEYSASRAPVTLVLGLDAASVL